MGCHCCQGEQLCQCGLCLPATAIWRLLSSGSLTWIRGTLESNTAPRASQTWLPKEVLDYPTGLQNQNFQVEGTVIKTSKQLHPYPSKPLARCHLGSCHMGWRAGTPVRGGPGAWQKPWVSLLFSPLPPALSSCLLSSVSSIVCTALVSSLTSWVFVWEGSLPRLTHCQMDHKAERALSLFAVLMVLPRVLCKRK